MTIFWEVLMVMVGGGKGSEGTTVDVRIRNRRFTKESEHFCSPHKIISVLCIVIMVQV